MQRGERPASVRSRQFGYPSPFRGQVRGIQSSLPCFPSMGLSSRRPPSLRRVPASPVPRVQRYYEGATTSRARIPGPLWFRFRAPHASPRSCPPKRSRRGGDRVRAWGLWSAGLPLSGITHMVTLGISQVPWRSIPYLCPVRRPRPDRRDLATRGLVDAAPGPNTPKAPAEHDTEAQPRALVSAAYASRATLPPPMQGSLPAGGLRLYREGVEPSGPRRKVSGHIRSPFQDLS